MADVNVDIEQIKLGLGRAIQRAANGWLSTMQNAAGEDEPSVILSRQGKSYPKYPYAIVDYIDQRQPDGWYLAELISEDNQSIEYHSTRILMFSVQVFDRRTNQQAASIANRIQSCFMQLPSIRKIIEDVGGAKLEYTYGIQNLSSVTKEGFLHSYGFNLTVGVSTVLTEYSDATGFIDVINLDVDLMKDEEDLNPLEVEINETIYP